MGELLPLALAGVAGVALGGVYFGGLWWTVREGVTSERPAALFLGSLILRMGLALGGLWWISAGHWERILAGLVGFIVARGLVSRLTRVKVASPRQEGEHASQP